MIDRWYFSFLKDKKDSYLLKITIKSNLKKVWNFYRTIILSKSEPDSWVDQKQILKAKWKLLKLNKVILWDHNYTFVYKIIQSNNF